jgi:hypothetical protein
MSSFKEENYQDHSYSDQINQENTNPDYEEEEQKFDLSNLITMLLNKNLKCIHLFACEKRILFLLVESQYNYFVIYIPSKFPIYYNNKTMKDFIPITNIKIEEDPDDENIVYDDPTLYNLKKGFDNKLPYFSNSAIKLCYLSRKLILFINRHNEVEKFVFETNVNYNSSFWIIDLENFYVKINNIEKEIATVANSILDNFYNEYVNNKNEALQFLQSKLSDIKSSEKSLLPYNNYTKRVATVKSQIAYEKNSETRLNLQDDYRKRTNKIENDYINTLLKWDNFFDKLNKIK